MSEPFRGESWPLAELLPGYGVTSTVNGQPADEVYVTTSLSSKIEWYADGSVFIDGVKVHDAWWRRALNWVDARLTSIRRRG